MMSKGTEAPLLVTPKRAQELLSCGATFYYELVGAGVIRQRKIGRRAARAVFADIIAIAEGRREAEIASLAAPRRGGGRPKQRTAA